MIFHKVGEPMKKRTRLFIFAGTFIILAIGFLASYFLITRLMDIDTYREQIISLAEKSLDRKVSYRSASFSWNHGPSFAFTGVEVGKKMSVGTFLTCKRLDFRLAVIPLLHKKIRVSGIVLESPVISLSRDQSGVFNISDIFRAKPGEYRLEVGDIRIRNGTIGFVDLKPDHEGFAASIENLDLYVSGFARSGTSVFRLTASLAGAGEKALISCSGKAGIAPSGKPLDDTLLDLSLSLKNLDAGRFWPYYGSRLPFERIRAVVDFGGVFRGKATEFTSQGTFAARGLRFAYPGVFRGVLAPKNLRFTYDMGLTPWKLSVNSLDMSLDGLRVRAGCSIHDLHGRDPFISARAATSPFSLSEFRRYIPFGIIAQGTAGFIEKHIADGIFRLDEGVLDGRMSRILNMDKAGNSNVLRIRGHVEKGIVGFGPRIPVFSDISGELELGGRDFSLRRMSGRFGSAPFTLDGRIADYSLATPSRYPFSAQITPGQAEIAWLLPRDKARRAVFRGPSALRLEGSGTLSDYRVRGDWNLDGAEYSYPALLHKRAGQPNRLSFALRLRNSEAELTDMLYHVNPMLLSASVKYRYGGRKHLVLAASTNRFHMDESSPLYPALQRFKPEGILQANIIGTGNPAEAGGMHWSGTVSIAAFSLEHHLPVSQLANMNGIISFHDSSLETEQVTASLGSSPIMVSGRLSGFSGPSADLVISSPTLRLKDLGFRSNGEEAEVKNLSGNIILKDKNVTVASLSGQVKSSSFQIQGNVANIENPRISMFVSFPFLRVEDLLPLTRLKRSGEAKGTAGVPPLLARITCEEGKFRDIPFRKFDAQLSLVHEQLLIRSLKAGIFSGTVSAAGRADFSSVAGPYYRAQYRLDLVDVAQIARAAGSKLTVVGLLTAGGELECRGNNMDELEKTARGYADVNLSNAMIRLEAQVGQKQAREVNFKKLAARLSFNSKVLEIQSALINTFGGVARGGGTVEFAGPAGPRYRIAGSMTSVDAGKFFSTFGVTNEVSGLLSLKADLSAKGDSVAMLKKTAHGTVGIHLKEGVINKFNILSKIFSILDLSQLLSFRLPDLVTTGMPYKRIDGNFSFNGGIVSTSDLAVKSYSINMTVDGKTDIVREKLDLKIGVQALRTVSSTVSRIPVIGWILGGGKRSFLVTYYEVKGKWSDPKISAIPVSSLGRGILNIFRRIFGLPEKLTTEPGEVIMGE
jgi:uncharacterized protein YhdP